LARKSKPLPLLENITITDVAAEGKAIARFEDRVIFVPFVAPGDIVDIQLTKKKSSYAEGRVVKFHHYSEKRTKPICEHFGICGGCKWQHLPYSEQLKFKQQQIFDSLTRIGKVDFPEILPILGSKKTDFYRNKLEYTFSNKRWLTDNERFSDTQFKDMDALGFHIPGMFDKVLDINKCWLQDNISNRIRLTIKAFCKANDYDFFDLRNQVGFMRNLIIRTSTTDEVMVIVIFFEDDREKRDKLLNHLTNEIQEITSLQYVVNQKANDTITDQEIVVFKGTDCIYEEMEELKFKISPKSFYQTNSDQAFTLYKVARDFATLTGNELVYDLYTGTGTIANFVAHQCRQVIGIEYVPEAIEDAKLNSKLNNIDNTQFFAGDMKDLLTADFITQFGKPDVIITDPPRAGMHDDVIKTILFAAPNRIVYVSCNPATQARDLSLLECQYRVERVQPVDMFPHTHHVENVILLKKII
jgi:23S rRNA (uracil1939-C5)-methyltransferase